MARWGLWLVLAVMAGPVGAAELRVAVAANFMAPMARLAAAFERESGHRLQLSYGSTGRLYAQIRNGAPFDVLLAADDETPTRLEKDGLAVAGTRQIYATGRLVLWSLQPGLVDAGGELLRRADVAQLHLSIADPKLAPYGRAAAQVLERMGVGDRWKARLVQGESIAQAHQFVASGNAKLGLVALSQVMEGGRLLQGSAWVVPASLHGPIRQEAVILKRAQGKAAALAFMVYLQSVTARSLIREAGYEV